MGDEERPESRTSVEDSRPKRRRNDVGKELRYHADNIRLLASSLIDAARESETPEQAETYSKHRGELMAEYYRLESVMKEWDQIQNDAEDTTEALEWRRTLHSLSNTYLETCEQDRDATFPENALLRRYQKMQATMQAAAANPNAKFLGPATEAALRDAAAEKSNGITFSHDASEASRSLRCIWKNLFHVTVTFSKYDIENIRVLAAGETKWPSRMDVFRTLEKQAYEAIRLMWSNVKCKTLDDVLAQLIAWFSDRRNLLTASCNVTGRYLAFGAVGEKGKLEVRPPMLRTRVEDKTPYGELKASFEPGVM
jgi:hypothetical protein